MTAQSYSHIGFWFLVPCTDEDQKAEGYFDMFVFVNHNKRIAELADKFRSYFSQTDNVDLIGYQETLVPKRASVLHLNVTLDVNFQIVLNQIEQYCESLYLC